MVGYCFLLWPLLANRVVKSFYQSESTQRPTKTIIYRTDVNTVGKKSFEN